MNSEPVNAYKNKKETLLVALGGNALIRKGQEGTIDEQFENLKIPIRQIAGLSKKYKIIITHGNGPQVGNLLLQQESCDKVPKLPLEILVAQTQGQIGYMIESTLDTALMEMGIDTRQLFVNVISYVVVDEKEDKQYDGIGERTLIFSPDSKRVAYAAIKGNKWCVIVDGKEDKQYDGVGEGAFIFSPDSKRMT